MLPVLDEPRRQHLERHLRPIRSVAEVDLAHAAACRAVRRPGIAPPACRQRLAREERRGDVGGRALDEIAGQLVGEEINDSTSLRSSGSSAQACVEEFARRSGGKLERGWKIPSICWSRSGFIADLTAPAVPGTARPWRAASPAPRWSRRSAAPRPLPCCSSRRSSAARRPCFRAGLTSRAPQRVVERDELRRALVPTRPRHRRA